MNAKISMLPRPPLRVAEVLTDTLRYEEPIEAPEVVGYQYDGSQQLIAIELADGGWTEYEYDALGRRVAKHHTAVGGSASSASAITSSVTELMKSGETSVP